MKFPGGMSYTGIQIVETLLKCFHEPPLRAVVDTFFYIRLEPFVRQGYGFLQLKSKWLPAKSVMYDGIYRIHVSRTDQVYKRLSFEFLPNPPDKRPYADYDWPRFSRYDSDPPPYILEAQKTLIRQLQKDWGACTTV